jgi:hypothetical protein
MRIQVIFTMDLTNDLGGASCLYDSEIRRAD